MKKNAKCFLLENGIYIEITYGELLKMKRNNELFKSRHFLPFSGMLLEIPEIEYKKMRSVNRRKQYVNQEEKKNNPISFQTITENLYGNEKVSETSRSVDELVIKNIEKETLMNCLNELDEKEYDLIYSIYFFRVSEREYSSRTGIPRSTVHYRLNKILDKLRKRF